LIALLLVSALPVAAQAALGGDVTTIEADRVRMKAALVTRQAAAAYTVHEIQTPGGTTVREFASADGVVFAVSWHGPFMPDLQQTLGTYFATFQAAPKTPGLGHSHLIVQQSDLVVHSSGHQRAFSGFAYVPKLVPAGVAVEALK
jgi:hypothetical protein